MNTTEVVAVLASNHRMTKAETRRLLDTITHTLSDNLVKGQSFSIPGLGTFNVHTRDERRSYNPHYEQYMKLPPKRIVNFSPSKGLKEDVKQVETDHE